MSDLWSAFSETCRRHAGKAAIVRGEERLLFADWRKRADAYLSTLLAAGIEKGDRVLVWAEPGAETASALCGIWGAGAIAVLVDTDSRTPFLDHVVATVAPRLLICPESSDPPISEAAVARLVYEHVVSGPGAGRPRSLAPTDPASILFTSGSTGRAKAVVQSHGALVRGCRSVAKTLAVSSETTNLSPVPWSFDYGFGQLHMSLVLGAQLVVPEALNPFSICSALEQSRPTLLAGVPSLFAYLLQGMSPFAQTNLSSLRKLTSTGSAMPRAMLERLKDLLPDAEIYLNYGLTESYRTTCLEPRRATERWDTVGRAIDGVEVLVVGEDGQIASPGELGEIVHCGDFLFQRYWGDPEATAQVLRPDPRWPDDRARPPVLFTGDFGALDHEGFLRFQGRQDRQLKVMGYRIHPLEIELALMASGLVEEAAVFGVERDPFGMELWAAVIARSGVQDAEGRLKRFSLTRLQRHQQPRRWIMKSSLPRNSNGKIDYPRLRAISS